MPAPDLHLSAPTLPYAVLDVFALPGVAASGNPLAVVLDAGELTAAQRQTLARAFALSETAFVLPPRRGGDYALRIHTPEVELAFAGHPSVGSAWLLHALGRIQPDEAGLVHQECGVGVLPLRLEGAARVRLSGGQPEVGGARDVGALLAACGLPPAAQAGAARWASTGLGAVIVPVRDTDLAAARPDLGALRRLLDGDNLMLVAGRPPALRARVFAADLGVGEDPATGSAALALGAYLAAEGLVEASGSSDYTIAQGAATGRPSMLHGSVDVADGQAVRCHVSGLVVPAARGEVAVPAR